MSMPRWQTSSTRIWCTTVINENEDLIPISKEDLIPFEEKSENWGARKMVIFEKNYDVLPTLESNFF